MVDSNVLFSALIRDSLTRTLLFSMDQEFVAPAYIVEEAERHRDILMRKSRMNGPDFDLLMRLVMGRVRLVPHETLDKHREMSLRCVGPIDLDDAPFIACALAHPGSVLWSDDSHLKKQSLVPVMTTAEMLSCWRR
ncbi:hypothetical protein JXB02_03790 [Candidatus Woesearchaeota archaeon]|nr:hypothetical protein [Candidatus Woesearchaeota archaeon]